MKRRLLTLLIGLITPLAANADPVLVEAEQFTQLGGWAVDQQFMDQMGSPYLLAHGLGTPVADAETTLTFPVAGAYRVWVRTRDWVAPWGKAGAPGRFQVIIDGRALDTEFGTEGAAWHWQDGGVTQVGADGVRVALHDLTGFEGRCDAILFAPENDTPPPDGGEALVQFRDTCRGGPAKLEEAGSFDLVVAGGGMAGTCAALSAARLGVRVALVQDRPVLGGNNSSEVRVWLSGTANHEPWPHVGDVLMEMDTKQSECPAPPEAYADDRKIALVRNEPNIALFLEYRVLAAEMGAPGRIQACIAQHIRTGQRFRFESRWFADCTGDASLGILAGADHETTFEGHMGPSNLWRLVDTGAPAPFPRCPWAFDLSDKAFPRELDRLGKWFWESGFDFDPIQDAERIRDNNFMGMYGAWDALKNTHGLYPNHHIDWAAYVAGKRESRRLFGDIILTQEDLMTPHPYDDGCVPTSWKIDLHLADPDYVDGFGKDAFLSVAHYTEYERPYWVPFRCLYSRNIANLFMAGRNISVTHQALGAVRVMRTTGMMGEIVGMAAAICKTHDCDPRGVYDKYLNELQEHMRSGVGKPKS